LTKQIQSKYRTDQLTGATMSNKPQSNLKTPAKPYKYDLNVAAVNQVSETQAHYNATPSKPAHFFTGSVAPATDDVYLNHRIISKGLPAASMKALNQQLPEWTAAEFASAINVSVRTYQRRLLDTDALLTVEQSDGVWQLSELLSLAISVFGTREVAARWFKTELPALGQRTPLELLATSAGKRIVEDHLNRIASGVYA
jgi:putative toxin-antitoxin system antitoxin component (TIGR02293 family)